LPHLRSIRLKDSVSVLKLLLAPVGQHAHFAGYQLIPWGIYVREQMDIADDS
jgi:hypothetical protein